MAFGKKIDNGAFIKLKSNISEGKLERLYIFYGEESYLKEYYKNQIVNQVDACGFGDFNIIRLSNENMDLNSLNDAIESMPMGDCKKLVIVDDYNLMRPTGDLKDKLDDILSNLPDYICLIFNYDALEFKPDKRLTLWKTIEKNGLAVEFQKAENSDLMPWIKRRFASVQKNIDREECEHLIFVCGGLMTNLTTEIEKIASGTRSDKVTNNDIDKLASRALEAQIFDLTDCIQKKNFSPAIQLLRDLFAAKNEPIVILNAITRQFQRLYAARLALENHLGEEYIMRTCGLRSAYPAKLLRQASMNMEIDWLRSALILCSETDLQIKSNIPDDRRAIELLILRLAQGAI